MKTISGKSLAMPVCAVLLASFALAPCAEARERGGGGGGGGARGGGDRAAARAGGAQPNRAQINNTNRDARAANVRNTSTSNVNRANVSNTNVNRNTNINASRNVNVNVEGRGGWDDDDYHPVATAAAVTAAVVVTSAVVGSIVRTPPANCVPVNHGGVVYQQCGSTWYQPQYVGSQVQYVVINPPY